MRGKEWIRGSVELLAVAVCVVRESVTTDRGIVEVQV